MGTVMGTATGAPLHVAVVRRPLAPGKEVPALVYPELREGSYRLVPKGTTTVVLEAVVHGGQVTTLDWPS